MSRCSALVSVVVFLPLVGGAWLYGQKPPAQIIDPEKLARFRKEENAKLAGLKGVLVTTFHGYTIKPAALQTAVELQLRRNGVPILTEEEFARTVGRPGLAAMIDTSCGEVYVILWETVVLLRDPSITFTAEVWSSSKQRFTPQQTDARELRHKLLDEVDEFCNAYLAANPKGRAKTDTPKEDKPLNSEGG